MRPLVLALPSGSRVVPGLAASLRETLIAAGADPITFSSADDGLTGLRAYRFRLPSRSLGGFATGIRWVLTYPLCQLEMAARVWTHRRRVDLVIGFLGCHFLVACLVARMLGLPFLYLPGGLPDERHTLLRPLHRAMVAFSSLVGVESDYEADRLAAGAKTVVGALRGLPDSPPGARVSTRRTVLFLSRLERHKGLDIVLGAARLLPPELRLVVAGDGPLRGDAASAAAEGRIEFRGWVSSEERWSLLREARMLVLPSRGGEGVPTVVLEAFRAGTPVLATNVGGIPEFVKDGQTGRLLPRRTGMRELATAIADVSQRPDLDEMGRRCRQVALTRVSMEAAARRFSQMLSRAPPRRTSRRSARFLATIATMGNALAGTLAVAAVLSGEAAARTVVTLFCIGLLLDGLDGRLARRFGSIPYGAALDASADLITYVLLPGALLLSFSPWASAVYVVAGAARLARFLRHPQAATYRGLPVSVAAVLLVASTFSYATRPLLWPIVLATSGLMHTSLPYPKLQARHAPWLWVLAAIAAVHAVLFAAFAAWQDRVLASALIGTWGVVAFAPLFARRALPSKVAAAPGQT